MIPDTKEKYDSTVKFQKLASDIRRDLRTLANMACLTSLSSRVDSCEHAHAIVESVLRDAMIAVDAAYVKFGKKKS